jgi:hypothetical protein
LSANPPPPKVLAFIICDDVYRENMTGKCSILGTFSRIVAKQFPTVHNELHVYIAMTDGRGSGRGKLQLQSLSKDETLLELQGNIEFPDPLAVVEMDFRIENLPFNEPGEYEFRMLYGDEPIGERKIVVRLGGNASEEKKA